MVSYTNRKGRVYSLHQGKTKAGKSKYYFSMKTEGNLVDHIPDGYEIFEHPNGMVYLSRITPKLVADEEIAMVENAVRDYAELTNFKVVTKKKQMVIFLPGRNFEEYGEKFKDYAGMGVGVEKLKKIFYDSLYYMPMMRFILEDKKNRTFRVDRWCFIGSVDDWLELDGGELEGLVERYCPHLGKDSFYKLGPW